MVVGTPLLFQINFLLFKRIIPPIFSPLFIPRSLILSLPPPLLPGHHPKFLPLSFTPHSSLSMTLRPILLCPPPPTRVSSKSSADPLLPSFSRQDPVHASNWLPYLLTPAPLQPKTSLLPCRTNPSSSLPVPLVPPIKPRSSSNFLLPLAAVLNGPPACPQ